MVDICQSLCSFSSLPSLQLFVISKHFPRTLESWTPRTLFFPPLHQPLLLHISHESRAAVHFQLFKNVVQVGLDRTSLIKSFSSIS